MLVAVQLGVRWEDAGVSVTACHVLQDVSVDKMKTLNSGTCTNCSPDDRH